jgi:hypothetical protein
MFGKNKILDNMQEQIDKLIDAVDKLNDLRDRKESDEPWVEVLGGNVDSEKGLEIKLDWNDAFVDQLKKKGYKGTTEQELISSYLLELSKSIGEES